MFSLKVFLVVLVCLAINIGRQDSTVHAAEDGKCEGKHQLECPYFTDICNETTFVEDCLDCTGFLNTDTKSGTCFNRKLLNAKDNPNGSYLWKDILGMVVWFLAAGVATACGVGGGGIYVPLGILLLTFSPKPSSGLSQASIFGASLGGLMLNIRNKHPFTTKMQRSSNDREPNRSVSVPTTDEGMQDTDSVTHYERPIIDYDMALFLAPMEMAGAVLGVLIQKVLPNWLYLTLAAIILGFTAKKTFSKFFDTRRKEQEAADEAGLSDTGTGLLVDAKHDPTSELQGKATSGAESSDEEVPRGDPLSSTSNIDQTWQNTSSEAADKASRCRAFLEQDSRQYPAEKLGALLVLWVGLVLLTFFKGGKGVDSIIGITCSSPWYAVLIGIQFCWTLGFSSLFGWKLMKRTAEKESVGYPFHPNDVFWDFSKTRFYAFFTFVAGIVAGLIGIGGGMVLGPLMLVMGIHPRVSSATTATMIVLTSSSVAILFVTAGLVPWQYAVTFFCICFSGAYLGKTQIDGYVKRTGKASLLILLLATIIALATVGCVVIVLTRLNSSGWCFDGLNEFCSITSGKENSDVCSVNRMLSGRLFQ